MYYQLRSTWEDFEHRCPSEEYGLWEAVFTRQESALGMAGMHLRMLQHTYPALGWRIIVAPVHPICLDDHLNFTHYGPDRVRTDQIVDWLPVPGATAFVHRLEVLCGSWSTHRVEVIVP